MSGPEHYRKAEQLLDGINESLQILRDHEGDPQIAQGISLIGVQVAGAQAHATLALAAATVECATEHYDDSMRHVQGNYITQGANAKAWQEVL